MPSGLSRLDAIKVGYWQLIDEQLRDKVQTAGRVDITDRIATMKTAMTGTHTNGDLTMDVQMARQQAQRAYSTLAALVGGNCLRRDRDGLRSGCDADGSCLRANTD